MAQRYGLLIGKVECLLLAIGLNTPNDPRTTRYTQLNAARSNTSGDRGGASRRGREHLSESLERDYQTRDILRNPSKDLWLNLSAPLLVA
jgi:hypothetical protein